MSISVPMAETGSRNTRSNAVKLIRKRRLLKKETRNQNWIWWKWKHTTVSQVFLWEVYDGISYELTDQEDHSSLIFTISRKDNILSTSNSLYDNITTQKSDGWRVLPFSCVKSSHHKEFKGPLPAPPTPSDDASKFESVLVLSVVKCYWDRWRLLAHPRMMSSESVDT